MAGTKPSVRNLLICPVDAVVLFVAFKNIHKLKWCFYIMLGKKTSKN